MCNTCGCNVTAGNEHLIQGDGKLAKTEEGRIAVTVLQNLLAENDHQALHNREYFDEHAVLVINLMSSPGSGKTALLENTIEALKDSLRIAVIEGDLETENDAERIRQKGVPAVQIVTGTACHLDAHLVHQAVHQLDLDNLDILFIENVGNLVCPASFDLGHHRNVTLLSVTEGDDKPLKYPVMFRASDAMLLTKVDLLPFLDDFDPQKAERNLRQLANYAPFLPLSAKKGLGMQAWIAWLRHELHVQRERLKTGRTARPAIQADGARIHAHSHEHHHHTHADGTTHVHSAHE
ncbi:hydrogenase nickel incorporation protein HypB [Beggiatoa leptomitoformis]|uniref:Hydrogenase maturation factor HypB n=1 Tax=Beggiatoa leptomitoformis TaxID=288004 RepID=A0A2N9YCK7_9GAMM|nr:hydrogenase nickel incorporation protein HypB [Beggiatoa leptomitoformis]ALG66547.1 hydrogenase nickel incorporation protein HypB [Beggiatoa leptomitoformis]AUI68154.1 hydrogenase nickel incorporation protein HypB [Beggiatoa leptomitoformis]